MFSAQLASNFVKFAFSPKLCPSCQKVFKEPKTQKRLKELLFCYFIYVFFFFFSFLFVFLVRWTEGPAHLALNPPLEDKGRKLLFSPYGGHCCLFCSVSLVSAYLFHSPFSLSVSLSLSLCIYIHTHIYLSLSVSFPALFLFFYFYLPCFFFIALFSLVMPCFLLFSWTSSKYYISRDFFVFSSCVDSASKSLLAIFSFHYLKLWFWYSIKAFVFK